MANLDHLYCKSPDDSLSTLTIDDVTGTEPLHLTEVLKMFSGFLCSRRNDMVREFILKNKCNKGESCLDSQHTIL